MRVLLCHSSECGCFYVTSLFHLQVLVLVLVLCYNRKGDVEQTLVKTKQARLGTLEHPRSLE